MGQFIDSNWKIMHKGVLNGRTLQTCHRWCNVSHMWIVVTLRIPRYPDIQIPMYTQLPRAAAHF